MEDGVSIVDPRNTYIDGRATIGQDTVIYPFSVISGGVKVGERCKVGPFAHLRDGTVLEDGVGGRGLRRGQPSRTWSRGRSPATWPTSGDAHIGRSVNVGRA